MSELPEDISWRNLLRLHVLEVADLLAAGAVTRADAARKLRDLATADVAEMDEADFEVDFDTGEAAALPFLAMAGARSKNTGDPVEDALTRVCKLRERNNGLRIVALAPGEGDIAAYQSALRDLHRALNAQDTNQKE